MDKHNIIQDATKEESRSRRPGDQGGYIHLHSTASKLRTKLHMIIKPPPINFLKGN